MDLNSKDPREFSKIGHLEVLAETGFELIHPFNGTSGNCKIICRRADNSRSFVVLTLGARGPGNQQKHLEYIAGSG